MIQGKACKKWIRK